MTGWCESSSKFWFPEVVRERKSLYMKLYVSNSIGGGSFPILKFCRIPIAEKCLHPKLIIAINLKLQWCCWLYPVVNTRWSAYRYLESFFSVRWKAKLSENMPKMITWTPTWRAFLSPHNPSWSQAPRVRHHSRWAVQKRRQLSLELQQSRHRKPSAFMAVSFHGPQPACVYHTVSFYPHFYDNWAAVVPNAPKWGTTETFNMVLAGSEMGFFWPPPPNASAPQAM